MRRVLPATLLALAALLCPATAALQAQTIPSPFRYVEQTQSLGGMIGYLWADAGEPPVGPQSAPQLDARYRARFTGPVSGEARLAVSPSSRTVFQAPVPGDSAFPITALDEVSSVLVVLQGSLILTLTGPRTWNGLAPYVGGGGGLVADLVGDSDLDAAIPQDQRFDFGPGLAVALQAGTDWYLSERLSIRFEARDDLWRVEVPQGLIFQLESETQWVHNPGLMVGAALHF